VYRRGVHQHPLKTGGGGGGQKPGRVFSKRRTKQKTVHWHVLRLYHVGPRNPRTPPVESDANFYSLKKPNLKYKRDLTGRALWCRKHLRLGVGLRPPRAPWGFVGGYGRRGQKPGRGHNILGETV